MGDVGNSLFPEVTAMALGRDTEGASAKLTELAETCHQQQLPEHRGRDDAQGRAEQGGQG